MSAELALIQKVELKIALATTPEGFQCAFDTYLPPLLLKFASNDQQVKTQIISTTKFLLSKFNTTSTLKVPVDALLKQVKTPNVPIGSDPASVQNYSLLFISKGIDRLDNKQKLDLFSQIWIQISTFTPSVAARLFNIGLKLLISFDGSIVPPLPEFKNEDDSKFIFEKFYKFMLLHPTKLTENGQIDNTVFQQGLSVSDVSFFYYQAGAIFTSNLLSTYKLNLLKFLDQIESSDKVLSLICSSSDGDSEISSIATTALKRVSIDYESHYLIQILIDMFIGKNRPQVRSQLQERIISILCKSKWAAFSKDLDQIAIIGMESSNNKLKQGTVSFLRWYTTVIATSEADDFNEELAINISEKLKFNLSSIDDHPQNFELYLTQRQAQYETLGLLLKKVPNLVTFAYINFFFHMVTVEDSSLKTTIQVVLTGLGSEIKLFNNSDKEKLYYLLKNTINDNPSEPVLKLVSIKLLNSVFDFENSDCRLLNIIALNGISTNEKTLVEEVNKGLHPYWFKVLSGADSIRFPNFGQLVSKLSDTFEVFDTSSINLAIKFTWNCLIMNAIGENERALQIVSSDQYWQTKIDNAIEYDDAVHKCLVDYVNNMDQLDYEGDIDMNKESSSDTIGQFLTILFKTASKSGFNLEILKIIYKLLSVSSDNTISGVVNDDNVDNFLNSALSLYSDESVHYTSAIIGILATHSNINNDSISKIISLLSTKQTPVYITLWGFIVSRLQIRGRLDSILGPDLIISQLVNITRALDSSSSRDVNSVLDVIGQLSAFGCLSFDNPELINLKKEIKGKIRKLVLKQNQAAITCWAYLSMSFDSSDSNDEGLNEFETTLYQTYNTKHTDYLFNVGECWTILANGWESKILKRFNDIQSVPNPVKNPNRVKIIFEIIMKACFNNKPSLRKAGCIWLLSMVQYSYDVIMTEKVKDIQNAFMRFLSDKEEIIQESATRGLSIIYENGDSELQDVLVHHLLSSFTDSNKTTKDIISDYVDQDTQLFDHGVMNTGDGKSVNTYKDVLSLASEVGDPSLVYKFMSLAKNSALWSSRKGIAFGLGTILDKSKLSSMMESNPMMAKRLIIKLWRYKHDPNAGVARTMNNIWDTLIVDPKKVIDDNFEIIFKECLSGMGSIEWRTREASTAALYELLNQVEFTKFDSNLKEIWRMSFRAMDDIKASVRKEGEKLTKFLASSMISKISASSGIDDVQSTILKQLIPFLLGDGGLLSDIEDVKSFAFETVMKLINTNSKALKPFVTEMVIQMVSMMSSVEPQFINYIALNADNYNLKAKDIDSQRLGMIGTSPLMTAIEKLLGLLDNASISTFINELKVCVKNAIGLPSKVAASKVIVDLIVRQLFLVKDHGDQLLKMASGQLKDRNDTVAKSYAMASGYVVRCSSIKAIQSLSKRLIKYYFEKKAETGEERYALVSAYTCECVFKFSNDKFQAIASAYLPLAFIGKHDPNEQIANNFKKVWIDTTNSSIGAIKLYFTDIIGLMNKHIDSTNLELRKTVAFSIIELVNQLGKEISTIEESQLLQLYDIILSSLKGRTYDGKEKLLQSLVLLAKNSKSYLTKNKELYNTVVDRILNEVKRKNDAYRKHGVLSFGLFLSSYSEHESLYAEYIKEVDMLMKQKSDEDVEMDDKVNLAIDTDNILFHQSLINNVLSSLANENMNYQALEYSIDSLFSQIQSVNVDMIKNKDGKHKYKLGILNLLRRLIAAVFGDTAGTTSVIGSAQDKYKVKILEIWNLIGTIVVSDNELQSIIVPFIRLTKSLIDDGKLTESEMEECTNMLINIKVNIDNTVVIKEVNNVLTKVDNKDTRN